MYSIVFLAVVAFFCCLVLTPLVRRGSQRAGVVDHPSSKRKVHSTPIPRTGGIAIIISYVAALGLLLLSPLNGADTVKVPAVTALVPAAVVMFLVGLVDDVLGLRAWQKLAGQVGAATLAYVAGVHVTGVGVFAVEGWWTYPLTLLWLIGCTNAFNLIDGMDGLATGVGLFATFTTLFAALLQNNTALALATAPLVGALVAFLRYNFNPASIFLGDCGSLTIGFLLGCFAAQWSQKSATLLGMTAPLMALVVPLLDTGVSVARRFLRRQPIFRADRHHLHHRLLDRGFTPRQVALLVYGGCGIAAVFSLLMSYPHNPFHGLLLVAFCLTVWLGLRLTGYVEFDAARHLVLSGAFRHMVNARVFLEKFERSAAVASTPEEYWTLVKEFVAEFNLPHVCMSLDGRVFEHHALDDQPEMCATMRIPLEGAGYVNLKYPAASSIRHAVAMTSIAGILQRSISSRFDEELQTAGLGPTPHVTPVTRGRRTVANV